jgi:hypothetical protein
MTVEAKATNKSSIKNAHIGQFYLHDFGDNNILPYIKLRKKET